MSETDYPEEFDRLMDEAAERMEENDHAAALPLLEEAAQVVPGDPEVWQRLGAVRFATGDLEAAEEAYRRWWEIAPRNVLAFRALANLLFRLGRFEEAESVALAWMVREPDDAYAMLLVANARFKRDDEFDSWLQSAQGADPELFADVMTGVFDFTHGKGPGEWTSMETADYLEMPETRLIERAAAGALPRYYDPETETFSFKRSDLDRRTEILDRYGLEGADDSESGELVEIDYATDIDDVGEEDEVRILLQKCPHCGEWTAGPLGDRERYFCCNTQMDPFIELSSEIEVRGQVIRKAGGGRALSEGIKHLTPDQMDELRGLWTDEQDWLSRADEMLNNLGSEGVRE